MRAYRITVPEQDEDLAVALVWEAGTAGIEMGASAAGRTTLLAYFEDETSLPGLKTRLPDVTIDKTPVPDVDWVARFRESFRSFRAGGFVIAPPWDVPTNTDTDATPLLVVDPGRAFGTGTHETTRLCLAALEQLAHGRALGRVCDVGAGTGILGIAAVRLGATLAVASDIDPEATSSARAHAALNHVPLGVVQGDGTAPFRRGAFDVVLANLTAPLLTAWARDLGALVRPGGALVLSGLLDTDLPDVQAAFEDRGLPEVRREGEWAALVYGSEAGS